MFIDLCIFFKLDNISALKDNVKQCKYAIKFLNFVIISFENKVTYIFIYFLTQSSCQLHYNLQNMCMCVYVCVDIRKRRKFKIIVDMRFDCNLIIFHKRVNVKVCHPPEQMLTLGSDSRVTSTRHPFAGAWRILPHCVHANTCSYTCTRANFLSLSITESQCGRIAIREE